MGARAERRAVLAASLVAWAQFVVQKPWAIVAVLELLDVELTGWFRHIDYVLLRKLFPSFSDRRDYFYNVALGYLVPLLSLAVGSSTHVRSKLRKLQN